MCKREKRGCGTITVMTKEEIIQDYRELMDDPPQDDRLREECVKLILDRTEQLAPKEREETIREMARISANLYLKMSAKEQSEFLSGATTISKIIRKA